ncbi:MAG: 4-hydroxy-tetrahydrodipicolinate reductase [Candidatus Eisenbacteria bacterium]|uniref:4-hydroxy-tetrahydrodipicolinate reductase n=1 Tax=Eiseniibacteriota bacterium TaxID=2212470 RepID=A0A538SH23_UNCEI|nr:MAG: 4-hydroxy-tetrahydrodipicolinate reductase [Candidatus Eisenbacteria bacterium]
MSRTRILLYGATGRMGRAIRAALPEFPDVELSLCVARGRDEQGAGSGSWMTPDQLLAKGSDLSPEIVVIDVSLAAGTARLLDWLERAPRPLVSATTGLADSEEARIGALASRAPVLRARNLSVGNALVTRMLRAVPEGARALFQIDLVEHHHAAKRDAPSGTALLWASLLEGERQGKGKGSAAPSTKERAPGEVRIHSIRSGNAVGTHRAILAGTGETIEIQHTVSDRAVFARGALCAARFLQGKPPALYTLEHALGEF